MRLIVGSGIITATILIEAVFTVSATRAQSALAQLDKANESRPDYDRLLASVPERGRSEVMAKLMAKDQCYYASDGCNSFSRRRRGYLPYLKIGFLTSENAILRKIYLTLDAERKFIGYTSFSTAVSCPRPPKYTCYGPAESGYDLNEPPRAAVPALATDPTNWIAGTLLHASWVDLASPAHSVGCLSLDPELSARPPGDLPSRKVAPRHWLCATP